MSSELITVGGSKRQERGRQAKRIGKRAEAALPIMAHGRM